MKCPRLINVFSIKQEDKRILLDEKPKLIATGIALEVPIG
jgi:hypothetical protein